MSPFRRRAVLLVLTVGFVTSSPAWGQDRPGFTARFLGWNPDSSDFAFVLTHHRRARNGRGMRTPKDGFFMKRVSPSGVAQPMKLRTSVRARAQARGYATTRVPGQRLSPYVQAFPMGDGLTVRVELRVGKRRLYYAYWLDDVTRPGVPARLLRGYLKEVWTDFDAQVYRSPDGAWIAVIVVMKTPYRIDARVDGVRIRTPAKRR